MKTLRGFYKTFHYIAVGLFAIAVLAASITGFELFFTGFWLAIALFFYGTSHVFGAFYRNRIKKYGNPKCCCGGKMAEVEEDKAIARVMKWKNLYAEGIITEREFVEKRNEILGLRK